MAITKVTRNLLSTGIDDQSNATAITIDSSENVLVGKTTAAFETAGVELKPSGETYVTRASATPLYVRRNTNDGNIVEFWKDGTAVGSIGIENTGLDLTIDGKGDINRAGIKLGYRALVPRYGGVDTDGGNDLGYPENRWKDLYLSGGVYLGGTVAAHHLDDYEEVNFTATLRGATAEPGTLLTVTGFATKIGRVVQYSIGFENVDTTGYAGLVTVTGLPFTNNGGRAIGNLVAYNGLTWTGSDCFSVINVNATILEALNISSAAPWGNSTHDPGATRFFWFTGTYMTTA
jgi:hypothetical protein